MKYLIFSLIFVLVGCAGKVRPDPALPAIQSIYPSAEIIACGKRWNGLGVCSLEKGKKYQNLGIKIASYYKGSIKVYSGRCSIDYSFRYDGSEEIPIIIPGKIDRDCLISMTVSPELPNEENSGIQIHSFRGYLAIRMTDGETWLGDTRKLTGSLDSYLRVDVGGVGQVSVELNGCGIAYRKNLTLTGGIAEIKLNEALAKTGPRICVLDGYISQGQFPDVYLNVLVAVYDSGFAPLPIPIVRHKNGKIEVEGDPSTSVIVLDDKHKFKTKAKFKFKKKDPHVLRLLTVKGRSVIGEWKKGSWSWSQ